MTPLWNGVTIRLSEGFGVRVGQTQLHPHALSFVSKNNRPRLYTKLTIQFHYFCHVAPVFSFLFERNLPHASRELHPGRGSGTDRERVAWSP